MDRRRFFRLEEVEAPVPGDNEVLIPVRATLVTPSDCFMRKGIPFIIRLIKGLIKPKHRILGFHSAREVASVGKEVSKFKKGNQVVAFTGTAEGCHAEYTCLPETGMLAIKPDSIDYGEAVGICDGGVTSLIFLRDKARVQSGQRVLLNGAGGSVGSFGVPLAILWSRGYRSVRWS